MMPIDFKDEFRQSMDTLRFPPANKERLRERIALLQSADQNRKAEKMKKRTIKRTALIAAACMMITGVSAFAAGKITRLTASSKSESEYASAAEMNASGEAVGQFPEVLGDGYQFAGGLNIHTEGEDQSGNSAGQWTDLSADYKDARGNTISLFMTAHPSEDGRAATEERIINGVKVRYNRDEYLMLPDESEPLDDAAKDRLEHDDHFYVSYGSSKKETVFYSGVSFEQDGIYYHLFTSDEITGGALFGMAAELIG